MGKNSVIRVTNYFLVGIFGSGGLAAMIGLLFLQRDRSIPLEDEGPRVVEILEVTPDAASGLADTDEDGMPDDWELRHGLNPDDASDASSDFDRDALTALQEFQHGTNPLGNWVEESVPERNLIVAERDARIYQAFSDAGHILTSGSSANSAVNPRSRAALWSFGSVYEEIKADFDAHIYAYDVNNAGVVVGGFTKVGESTIRPFSWTSGGPFVELDIPSGMDTFCLAYRINNRGEILLQSHESSEFVSLVIDADGKPIEGTKLGKSSENPRLIELNDFGGLLGVYTSLFDGFPKVLLKFPDGSQFNTQLDAGYPELFGHDFSSSFFTAKMNNYGEFGNDFDLRGSTSDPSGFFFYDGDYRSFRESEDHDIFLLGLNDVPQILFKAMIDGEADYRLSSGGQVISLDLIGLEDRSGFETSVVALNEKGEILGYRKGEGSSRHEVFVLRPELDFDDDGLSNDWENFYGLNPNDGSDGLVDSDGDGLNNLAEFRLKRNPAIDEGPNAVDGNVPDMRAGIDTDGDGMPNIWEITYGLNWDDPSDAHLDLDRDGYTNLQEFFLGTTPAGDPVFEAIAIELEEGSRPRSMSFAGGGSLLGSAINTSNQWQGFELTRDGTTKWFYAADGGDKSSVGASNSTYIGGGGKNAGETYFKPVLWDRETLQSISLQFPFTISQGEVIGLRHDGSSGAIVFTKPQSRFKYELALSDGSAINQLSIFGSLGLSGKHTVSMHQSGAGIASVRFAGWKHDVVI